MRRIIGYTLVATPLVAIAAFLWTQGGFTADAIVFGGVAVVVGFVATGLWLIQGASS